MKQFIYTTVLFILISGSFSCKKFLEEENISGITGDNFYGDVNGYEKLINSCYSAMRDIYSGDPWLFSWGTDIFTRGEVESTSGAAAQSIQRASQLNEYKTLSADNPYVTEVFTDLYIGIQRCNTAINKADIIPGLADNLKFKRVAEIRFIRAYFYYLLVENFGGVSIVKEEISTPVTHFERNSEQEVYTFIIEELNAALPGLEPTTAEFGRVSQTAVKQLLTLAHLTRGYKSFAEDTDFGKAAQYAEEIIGGGHHNLLSSFADVFKADNQKNNEIIFSIQYDASSLTDKTIGNGQNAIFGWRIFYEAGFYEGETAIYNKRISDFMPTQFLYKLYNTSLDARYDATFLSEFYATKDAVNGTATIKKGDLRFYFPKADQPFSQQDADNLKASNPNVEIIRFDQWKQNFNGITGALKFPMVNKFFDPDAAFPGNSQAQYRSTRDIVIFRLAETYLLAAEAYFKMNQPDKAADKLNVIRERAAIAGQVNEMRIDGSDVTIDFILDERARELAGEYKRWLDLKRTRRLSRAFENNLLTKMENGAGVIDKYYLRPIPQTVIDRDSQGYPQNDQY